MNNVPQAADMSLNCADSKNIIGSNILLMQKACCTSLTSKRKEKKISGKVYLREKISSRPIRSAYQYGRT